MLKLISQFDTQKTRPSLATPTCCCCCCCVVTMIGYTVVTTRMLLKEDTSFGPIEKTDSNKGNMFIPSIILVSALLCIGLPYTGIFQHHFAENIAFFGLILIPVGFITSLFFLRHYKEIPLSKLSLMVVITLVVFALEFYIWLSNV